MARLQRACAIGMSGDVVTQDMRWNGSLRLMDAGTAAGAGIAAVLGRMSGLYG